jgi:Lecithin retinol acyltransferase
MKPGDHIYVDRGAYTHHGICITSRKIIHFNGRPFQDNKDSVICYTTPQKFAGNKEIQVKDHGDRPSLSYSKAVERAKSLLGKNRYNLIDHNCEHFASWCVTGKSDSGQIGMWANIAASIGVTAVLGVVVVPLIPAGAVGMIVLSAVGVSLIVVRNLTNATVRKGKDF